MSISVFSTATDLGAAVGSGAATSRSICQMYLDRIAAKNSLVNAVVVQRAASAILADADAADARASAGARLSALDGVPFTLKLALETQGVQTANNDGSNNSGSPLLDSDIAAKLKAAGCILLGKSNGPGLFPFRTRTFLGETKNPRNALYATGGSSGGAAAAVASGFSGFDIAIDSAGSARIPASFCGVYGFKPTNNAVSGFGDWTVNMPSQPPAQMLDLYAYGPITRSLDDVAAIYSILAGPTQMRPNIPPLTPVASPTLRKVLSVKTIGPWFCNPFVQNAVDALMASQSFSVSPLNINWFNEADLNNVYAGLSSDPNALPSTFAKSENPWFAAQLSYATSFASHNPQATAHALWLSEVLASTMGDADALVMGTTALSPPTISGADPSGSPYLAFTALFSITGNPAVSIPLGTDPSTGVSFGLQVVGRHWRDLDLLALAGQITGLPGFQPPTL